MMENMLIIEKLEDLTEAPFHLLYDADPSEVAVKDYLKRGICYVAYADDALVGVYVILPTRPFTIELVNLAIEKDFRMQGYGRKLVLHAIEEAKSIGYKTFEVGTGNSSIDQLALYQKAGLEIVGIDFNFFNRYYDDVIIENEIECKHMIRLALNLG